MTQVVVLAGGLATRMQPRTATLPKILLPVAGRPFLDHLLARLASSGVDDVVLLTGHLGDEVARHVARGVPAALRVTLHPDGATLRGTGGALRAAAHLLADTFVVTYGDAYLRFDYRAPLEALSRSPNAEGCMAVYENRGAFDRSNVRIEGDHVAAYEKTGADARFDFIDYGATALRKHVVEAMPEGVVDLSTALSALARRGELLAHVVGERFYEVGSPAGLADLEAFLGEA